MNRNPQKKESSLLLQLPNCVTFSDMTENSFLIPVAVDNVAVPENSLQNATSTERNERISNISQAASVCQLQQPLLMPKGSSGPMMDVPYSESNAQNAIIDSIQAEVTHSRSSLQPSISDLAISSQNSETQNCPNSSTVTSSNTISSGFQNQPPALSDSVNQLNPFVSKPLNHGNMNVEYHVFPQETSVPSVSNYPVDNVPVMTSVFPGFTEKNSECHNASSSTADYYSQPPVITPTTSPVFYNSSGRNVPQVPQAAYSNISNQSYNTSNVMTTEFYSRVYEPAHPYWLFRDVIETKEIWYGFSLKDAWDLEAAFQQDPQSIVPVDGGRYDAILSERIKKPVYFEAKDLQIRRCTWFYRPDSSQRFMPFPEEASNLLEQHYATCVTSGQWQKRVNLPGIGSVVFESPQLLLYYKNEVDIWPSLPDSKASPKPVRRGLPENLEIMPSEDNQVDHLVFIVQGIGSFCDLRFRTVAECVDGFRDIANKLLVSHFQQERENGQVERVEFLPLAWHAKLHTSDKGFDRCMQNITLPSIPKLRHFTNDTLLDILLYSSPTYCQSIIDTVTSELNKLYEIFLRRNPGFSGSVFVAGHSLGSLILFDILAHQKVEEDVNTLGDELHIDEKESQNMVESENNKVTCDDNIKDAYDSIESLLQACQLEEYKELFEKEKIDLSSVSFLSNDDLKDLGLPTGPRKKLLNAIHFNNQKSLPEGAEDASGSPPCMPLKDQKIPEKEIKDSSSHPDCLGFPFKSSPCMSSVIYPKLHFKPACFFALGSPISMFLAVRGYDYISENFRFPTCPGFFHIFHPYDPVAFRIEPLIDPTFSAPPVLIPHHKGRKRMHLAIRENLSKVGSEIKQKILETLRYTWDSLSGFAVGHTLTAAEMEAEVDKLVNRQMSESEFETQAPSETSGEDIQIGSLNGGRRIDYVLQEKPIEALNDYIFALTSHATYWDSEDTVLMILREIYATQGIVISSQSPEAKLYLPSEQAFYETSPQFKPVMSNPAYKSPLSEPVNLDRHFKEHQTLPSGSFPTPQMSSSSVNKYSAPVSQVSNNVPPTITSQPVGPPPLTGFVKRSPFARGMQN